MEIAPTARVTAVDVGGQWAAEIHGNLQQLGIQAEIIIGDGYTPEDWYNNRSFDRILLDSPSSAMRISPSWPKCSGKSCMPPGGTLLYATCSILPKENRDRIAAFLAGHSDARLQETDDAAALGLQYLPSSASGNDFFYAKMIKKNAGGKSGR